MKRLMFNNKFSLKSHMDGVRGLHLIPSLNSLVSASEDCTIKVWDVARFFTLKDIEGVHNFEPYLTLRGHKDPIFSLSGRLISQQTTNPSSIDSIVLSGSSKGTIKAWRIPTAN
mmetsp:Transcript_41096/g.39612  ORF Transcript_41096/g.39612 Transcript_41096/m.39612 type:complete len:114 (+) Transcript_41096:64-405(+)